MVSAGIQRKGAKARRRKVGRADYIYAVSVRMMRLNVCQSAWAWQRLAVLLNDESDGVTVKYADVIADIRAATRLAFRAWDVKEAVEQERTEVTEI